MMHNKRKGNNMMSNFFIRDERGGVLIFMGLFVAILIVAVGLAIDAGRAFLVHSKAQTALDAAVASAAAVSYQPIEGDAQDAAELNALLEKRGDEFFAANFPSGYMGVNVGAGNATFTPIDNGTSVRGDLNITLNTFFGDFAMTFVGGQGLDRVNMAEFAQVERVIPDIDIEISLALDYTGSMCRPCAKFEAMRESTGILIDTLEASLQATSGDSTIHYAFVPFTHTVKVNNVARNLSQRALGTFYDATYNSLPNVLGLGEGANQINRIKGALNSITPNVSGVSGTNVGVGANWGWKALRAGSSGDFRGISAHRKVPAPMNDGETYKMLILLSDGKNERTYFDGTRGGWDNPRQDDPEADAAQRAACAGAKREGIEVRVIPFQVPDADAQARLRACASERDGVVFYYPVDDPEELVDVFREIANDLIDLRLRK